MSVLADSVIQSFGGDFLFGRGQLPIRFLSTGISLYRKFCMIIKPIMHRRGFSHVRECVPWAAFATSEYILRNFAVWERLEELGQFIYRRNFVIGKYRGEFRVLVINRFNG